MNIRRQFITDCVESYKKKNRVDYDLFVDQVKKRRDGMLDKNLGHLKGEKELRLALSIPEKLYRMLEIAFTEEDKRLLEGKGEMRWFVKKYPEFLIPNEY